VLLCRNKIGTTHQGPPRLLTTQHNNDNKAIDWLRQGRFYPLSWSKERWMNLHPYARAGVTDVLWQKRAASNEKG